MSGSSKISPRSSPFLISPTADFCGFVLPLIFSFAITALTRNIDELSVPFVWWFLLGICIDVAHVYGTIFRTILDSEATRQNWALYIVTGPVLLLATLAVNIILGTKVGWTISAYFAMFHFAKQPYGVLSLYKVRKGERFPEDNDLDYYTCILGALIPILVVHAPDEPDVRLRWFNAEEFFLFTLPPQVIPFLMVSQVVVLLFWLARTWHLAQRRGSGVNYGKVWIMITQYIIWNFGSSNHLLSSLAFHNVCHGVASSILVWHVSSLRYDKWQKESPHTMTAVDRLGARCLASPWRYVAIMVALAMFEELGWEVLINHEILPDFGYRPPRLSARRQAIVTSLLMWPQLAHYLLDCFIWKMALKNPGLREAFTPQDAYRESIRLRRKLD